MSEIRSNLKYWKEMQDNGYFEQHSCYNGLKDLGDDVTSIINKFLKLDFDMIVVVIGCGYGRETMYIAPHVNHVFGIDVNETILNKAVNYLNEASIKNFTGILAENYDELIPNGIDLVFSIVVMQHLTRDLVRDYFKRLKNKLNKDGIFVVQFLENLNNDVYSDAQLRTYEPSVSWNPSQIKELAHLSGLSVEIQTSQVTPKALWHWACFKQLSSI